MHIITSGDEKFLKHKGHSKINIFSLWIACEADDVDDTCLSMQLKRETSIKLKIYIY